MSNKFSALALDDSADGPATKDRREEKRKKREAKIKAEAEARKSAEAAKNRSREAHRDTDDLRAAAFGGGGKKNKSKKKAGNKTAGSPADAANQGGDGDDAAAAANGSLSEKDRARLDEDFRQWQIKDKEAQDEAFLSDMERAISVSMQEEARRREQAAIEFALLGAQQQRQVPPQVANKRGQQVLFSSGSVVSQQMAGRTAAVPQPPAKKELSDNDILRLSHEGAELALRRERRLEELTSGPVAGKTPGDPPVIASNGHQQRNGSSSPSLPADAFSAAAISRLNRELSLKEAATSLLRRQNEALSAANAELSARLRETENREKDEMAAEIAQLKTVRDDLMEELTRLQGDLERERTHSQDLARQLRKAQETRRASSKQE